MIVDCIIISCNKNAKLKSLTDNCIKSLHESEYMHTFNVIVIETGNKDTVYDNATTYHFIQSSNFNYNRTVNFGLQFCKNKYIGFFNNDLIFESGWFSKMLPGFKKYGSISARCELSHSKINFENDFEEGYEVRRQLNGWAIVTTKQTIKKIGGLLDESVDFWLSESVYANQLRNANIIHAVSTKSIINHLGNGSNTLNQIESNLKKEFTHKQYHKTKIFRMQKKFSVIMPVFLGEYKNCASDRERKFIRAVKSVLNQTFKDFELIIISDGCDKTVELYQRLFSTNKNVICIKISKQEYLSGLVRQAGINKAFGEYIIYCDSDDFYGENHLLKVNNWLKDKTDWIYYNDILNSNPKRIKNVELKMGLAGTSSICHKRLLNVDWSNCNGYTHDFRFIQQLINQYPNYKKCGLSEYYICHTVNSGIDV